MESPIPHPLDRLRQRQSQLRQTLAGATDRTQLLAIAMGHLRTSLKGSRALLYQFETAEQGKVLAESVERGWTPTVQARLPATFLGCDRQDDYARQGTLTFAYSAAQQVTPYQRQLLEQYQVRSSLATPLYGGNPAAPLEPWGLLVVQQCDRARAWSAAEQLELEQMALLVALALGQQAQQVEGATQQRRAQAITQLSERIRQGLEIKTIFQTTTQTLRQLLRADRVLLYRFNADWSGKVVAESVGGGWVSLMQNPPDAALLQANSQACAQQWLTASGQAGSRKAGSGKAERPESPSTSETPEHPEPTSRDTYLQQSQGGRNSLGPDSVGNNSVGNNPLGHHSGDRVRVVADVAAANFPDCYRELLEQMQTRAYLIVNLYQGEQLWGLLAVYQCAGPRAWSATDQQLTEQIAEQLGVALQQALMQRQQRQQTERLEQALARERAIATISHKIKDSTNIESLLRIVTHEARKLLGADRVAIYRFGADWTGRFVAESVGGNWRSLLREQDLDPQLLQGARSAIDMAGCTLQTLESPQFSYSDTWLRDTQGGSYTRGEAARVCEDVRQAGFPDCYLELLEQFQTRAYITVPLFLDRQLWGLMPCYQCAQPRAWQPEEVQLAVNLGGQVSIALQRMADLAAVQQEREKLEQALERERAIATISQSIRDTQTIDSIFRIASQEARQLLGADRVVIYRFDPDWSGVFVAESVAPGWVSLLGQQEQDPSLLAQMKNNIDTVGCTIKNLRACELGAQDTYLQDTQGGVYRQGQTYRACPDVNQAGFPDCYLDLLTSFQAQAYLTVPVFLQERLWGLLACYQCSGPRDWTAAEIQLMVQLGAQLGIALHRAADLAQLREQSQELAAAAQREKQARETLQQQAMALLAAVRPALDGNLMVRAPVTENELGTIADLYNNTLQSLRAIVQQVKQAGQDVATTSEANDIQIQQLAQRAEQQSQSLALALGEVQAVVRSAQAVGADALTIEQAVQNANQTVAAGDGAMNRTVASITTIRETVTAANQKIQALGESSQKIDRVVNLIRDFATQTQLLSLNAAIEATRAGEYGKGFAVVADEVRSLARQSAAASGEISDLVAAIRQQTQAVMQTTAEAIAQVSTGTQLVTETQGNLTAIATATAQISSLVTEINQATTAQLEQSQSVTQTMEAVAELAHQTSAESLHLSEQVQTTVTTAQQLQTVVNQFKVD
ncbi:MAG: GAF domain-containing protein [Spirulinaceae cyanobacterium]